MLSTINKRGGVVGAIKNSRECDKLLYTCQYTQYLTILYINIFCIKCDQKCDQKCNQRELLLLL